MHVHSPILHGQLKENKIGQITLIVWVLGRVEKKPKKGSKIEENFFSLTGLFFRPVAVPYPIKNPLNHFSLKVTKFHGDSVKKTKGDAKRPPPQRV